jgi:hypothetical protein
VILFLSLTRVTSINNTRAVFYRNPVAFYVTMDNCTNMTPSLIVSFSIKVNGIFSLLCVGLISCLVSIDKCMGYYGLFYVGGAGLLKDNMRDEIRKWFVTR